MFLKPAEVAEMYSNDFLGDKVKHAPAYMADDAARDREDGEPYRENLASGKRYSDHEDYLRDLQHTVDEHGGFHTPVTASVDTPWHAGHSGPTIYNGHHRAVVAMRTGRLLPVDWSADAHEARARMEWDW